MATVIIVGMIFGHSISKIIFKSPHPSTLAASIKSLGMSLKACRKRMMAKALFSAGTMSAAKVSTHLKFIIKI